MQVHDYDQFRVDDGAEVLDLLRRTAASRALCAVRAAGRPESYLSPLRELADDGDPVLDPPRAPVIERALSPGSIAEIDVRLPEGRVTFSTRVSRIGSSGGRSLLRLERPAALVRVLKRDTFRVQMPESHAVRLTFDASDPALTSVAMHDLSVQGGSMTVVGVRGLIDAGTLFESTEVALPDGGSWRVAVRVVHAGLVRRARDGAQMRIGVQFVAPPDGFESAIARLVGRVARSAPRA